MNGFKQVFFLFKTVSFISHILTALTPYPANHLTINALKRTMGSVRLLRSFNMKTKALAREDRLRQILQCFAVELQSGRSGELTVADVAKKLRLAASTKLRLMLEELVMDSQLIVTREDIPGVAKFRRIYRPNLGEFDLPKPQYKGEKRSIRINSRQMSFIEEVQ
jgi:hypothetical protein